VNGALASMIKMIKEFHKRNFD